MTVLLSLDLKTGTILAIVRQLGNTPKPKQALIKTAKIGDKISAAILTKLILIPSNPQLLFVFK